MDRPIDTVNTFHAGTVFADVLVLLVTVLVAAIGARYTRIPYTVGLVVLGLIIGALPGHPSVALTPNLVMLVFLPALLFAGAWTYPVQQLRRNWLPIPTDVFPAPFTKPSIIPWSMPRQKITVEIASSGFTNSAP